MPVPYDFCNTSESFFREIRQVVLYRSASFSFNEMMNQRLPLASEMLMRFSIHNPQDFRRKITTKADSYNDYLMVDISFPLLDLKKENRRLLYAYACRNRYAVMLLSNQERVIFGNHREPMSLEVHDSIREDASGKDHLLVKIYGKTTIKPSLQKLQERFRVLFFLPRLK